MPRGGARRGAGAPLGNKNRLGGHGGGAGLPHAGDRPPRPRFETGREFAIWALNACDDETPMAVKVRAMQELMALEGKVAEVKNSAPVAEDAEDRLYKPRAGFRVVG